MAFNYTSRDYNTIRSDLLARAAEKIPSWNTRDPSDFGMALVDLWAYMGDVLHYYVDRSAGEAFLDTATQRESILAIANLMDYRPNERTAARATVSMSLDNTSPADPVVVPAGTVLIAPATASEDVTFFTTDNNVSIAKGSTVTGIAVTEGTLFNETLTNSSPGTPSVRLTIPSTGVVPSSIKIYVQEGPVVSGEVTEVQYSYVPSLLSASYDSKVFTTITSPNDEVTVLFGNSVNGAIPTLRARIRAEYRTSVGQKGNIGAGRITAFRTPVNSLRVHSSTVSVGGKNAETIESMRSSIPRAIRTNNRAVTLSDFEDLSLSFTGVAKVKAAKEGSPASGDIVTVRVYAVPYISNYTTTPAVLTDTPNVTDLGSDGAFIMSNLQSDLASKAMLGVGVVVNTTVAFDYVHVKLNTLAVKPGYVQSEVKANVISTIRDIFTFDNVSFNQSIRIGDIYRTILSVTGVDYIDLAGTYIGTSTPTFTLTDKTAAVNKLPRINTSATNGIVITTTTGGITGSN